MIIHYYSFVPLHATGGGRGREDRPVGARADRLAGSGVEVVPLDDLYQGGFRPPLLRQNPSQSTGTPLRLYLFF